MRVTQIAIIHDHLVASYDMQGQDIGAIALYFVKACIVFYVNYTDCNDL